MRNLKLTSSNHLGFTLIETLVGLIIFTIVLLANGKVMSNILKLQAESNIQLIVIDVMQTRLQKAQMDPSADPCAGVDTSTISIKDTDFFIACTTDNIDKDGIIAEWPVLGAHINESEAQGCADGTSNSNSCYVVGR